MHILLQEYKELQLLLSEILQHTETPRLEWKRGEWNPKNMKIINSEKWSKGVITTRHPILL